MVLAVGPGVLVPRPETEAVVEIVMDLLKSKSHAGGKMEAELMQTPWLDLGTGSGGAACWHLFIHLSFILMQGLKYLSEFMLCFGAVAFEQHCLPTPTQCSWLQQTFCGLDCKAD
jgi:hypothetical protein